MDSKYKSQESYNERMKKRGFIKVGAWVPVEDREELLDIAHEMRSDFAKKKGFQLEDV